MASLELLERFRASGHRERIAVLEHEPPRELVTPIDIIRTDAIGRRVVSCPAGQVPPHWLQLTSKERDALVEPAPRPPAGYLHPGAGGFCPEGVVVGGWLIEHPDR